jgi:alkyl sulfatase BDS1-like metallo-beta-lactamase superfamily hydrolase
MAYSLKMDKGIFVIKDEYYKVWGYGLIFATIIKSDDGLIVLDPMESANAGTLILSIWTFLVSH